MLLRSPQEAAPFSLPCHLPVQLYRRWLGLGVQGWGHSLLSLSEGIHRRSIRRAFLVNCPGGKLLSFITLLVLFVSYAN